MPGIRKLSLLSFFLSGFSALSYQVLWKRYLSLALGSTVYAISSVIIVFMGGLVLEAYCLVGSVIGEEDPFLSIFSPGIHWCDSDPAPCFSPDDIKECVKPSLMDFYAPDYFSLAASAVNTYGWNIPCGFKGT